MGEIRFVGTGETRGYPYLVCKNISCRLHTKYIDSRNKIIIIKHLIIISPVR